MIYIAHIHTRKERGLSAWNWNKTWTKHEGRKDKQQY